MLFSFRQLLGFFEFRATANGLSVGKLGTVHLGKSRLERFAYLGANRLASGAGAGGVETTTSP